MIHEYDLGGRRIDYRSETFLDEVITLYKKGKIIYTRRTQGDHVILLEENTFSNFEYYRLFITTEGKGELWGRRKAHSEGAGLLADEAKENPHFLLQSAIREDELLLSKVDEKTPHRLLVGAKNISGKPHIVVWRSFIYTPDFPEAGLDFDSNLALATLSSRRIQ